MPLGKLAKNLLVLTGSLNTSGSNSRNCKAR